MMPLGRSALEAIRFSPETLRQLVAAIDVNDRIDLAAPPPVSVGLDHPPERFVEGFALSRQLWQEGFDWRMLLAMAGRLRRGDVLDADERHRFKQVRARFKHLRFAFFLYSAGHRSPRLLSLVTLVLGEVQDAMRVRGPRDVRRHANRLQLLLAEPARRLLVRETDRLVVSDTAGFARFAAAEVRSLRPMLSSPAIGAHAFHAARKVVSRQVSFHDDMRTLHPGEAHRAAARWLATLNGLMGQFHDDLVARGAAGGFSYARDTFALPEEIRVRLETLVEIYRGSSSSEPPAA